MNALTTTFYQLLGDNLGVRPNKQAFVDSDRDVTYAEVCDEVDRLAGYLRSLGVSPGDRVIIHLRKSIAEVVSMFAASKIGAVVVNVSVQWTANQLEYVADDCAARVIIVEPRIAAALADRRLARSLPTIVVMGKAPDSRDFASWDNSKSGPGEREISRLDTELAMIVYTSGSTGQPKGVMLSHRNIITGARSVARYLRLVMTIAS